MEPTEDTLTRFTAILTSVQGLETLRERLCEASRLMLDAGGVVVTSATVEDGRTTVCWTQLLSRRLEALQDDSGEGPMIDAFGTGEVVLGDFAATDDRRWPVLRRRVADLGFTGTLIAIPLRSELDLNGVLMVHREGAMRETDAEDATFLGGAIGTAVLQDPSLGAQGYVYAEILTDREQVHRATEVLMSEASLSHEDALALLRALAFSREEPLRDTAQAVIDGRAGLHQPSGG